MVRTAFFECVPTRIHTKEECWIRVNNFIRVSKLLFAVVGMLVDARNHCYLRRIVAYFVIDVDTRASGVTRWRGT